MSRKTRQCVVVSVVTATVLFITIALLKQHFSHVAAREEDQWRFAYRPASWNLITRIQRYPLFSGEEPDWEALVRHEDPFVRAAAALAIGREAAPDNIRLLTPLLNDDFQFTRKSALWALMQFRSLSIKKPLFSVIGSWEYLIEENGSTLIGSSSRLVGFFRRIALSTKLLDMPLADRRAWLKTPEATKWIPTLEGPAYRDYGIYSRSNKAAVSFEESTWDAGDKVLMRIRSVRSISSNSKRSRISGRGDWFGVNIAGQIATKSERTQRRRIESELLEFDPNGLILTDQSLTPEVPLSPGIYLFCFRGQTPADAMHIARVQRSEEAEESIPDLLNRLNDSDDRRLSKTVYSIAEHRVKAAIPKLIGLFRESGAKSENPHNFAIAEAFGRIGDSRAVPHLLDFPFIHNLDVLGDTSLALKSFGPDAYPHCEHLILAWKDTVDRYRSSLEPRPIEIRKRSQLEKMRPVLALEMSLRILGHAGSEKVDRVRLKLIQELASDAKELTEGGFSPVLLVLRSAILAVACKHPDDVVEAIWATRANSAVTQEILSELRKPRTPGAKQVCLALWERLQKHPGKYPRIESYMKGKVLSRVAPDFKP